MNELSIFNPFFDDVYGFDVPTLFASKAGGAPKVDVTETAESYVLDMDLPGKSEKDVDIDLKDNVLSISSKEVEDKKEKDEKNPDAPQYLIRERRSVQFTRRFSLPNDVDGEKIQANFHNGVLEIMMPRRAAMQAKKIAISAS